MPGSSVPSSCALNTNISHAARSSYHPYPRQSCGANGRRCYHYSNPPIRTTVNDTAIWILVSAAIAVLSISVFNRLVRARNQRRNAWASVEVNLKKRHDLIPNLVETVRGYSEHEQEVLERVIEKRREELNLNTRIWSKQ